MKRRVAALIVMAFVFTSIFGLTCSNIDMAAAATPMQQMKATEGVVTADSLNVRQGASTSYPVVCVLRAGQKVKVFGKLGDWYAVYEAKGGCVGAVASKYINIGGGAPSNPVNKLPTTNPPKVQKPMAVPSGVSQDDQTLLTLVNKARANAGAGALEFDMNVVKVARIKAKDMVDNNYFSHQSPTYGSPFDMMRQFGVSFKSAGENIAGNATVEGAFDAWMKSEGHRKNILNGNFNYCGFGIVPSPTYGKMLVQQFIRK